MLVSEFIKWLQTQDQGAIVEVVVQREPHNYESYGHCDTVNFDKENYDHVEYTDLRDNPNVGVDSFLFNKRYLKLGSGL